MISILTSNYVDLKHLLNIKHRWVLDGKFEYPTTK